MGPVISALHWNMAWASIVVFNKARLGQIMSFEIDFFHILMLLFLLKYFSLVCLTVYPI